MDLSALEGDDPAGYKAEQQIKRRLAETSTPPNDWERPSTHQGRQQNPGSVAAADSGQFHAYRKNRRHELDRLEALNRIQLAEEEQQEFQQRKQEREAIEAAKTAKRRAKRKTRVEKKQKPTAHLEADFQGNSGLEAHE